MSFSKVVLPQPLGPSTTIVWPSGTRSVKSCMAMVVLWPRLHVMEGMGSLSVLQMLQRSIRATAIPPPGWPSVEESAPSSIT
jgi:hypothetical protein